MKHLTRVFAVAALAFGLMAATIYDAEAGRRYRHHHNNAGAYIAGAIIGGLALGALANRHRRDRYYDYSRYNGDRCYRGPRRCRKRVRCFVDDYGYEHCRRVRNCYRPVYCD